VLLGVAENLQFEEQIFLPATPAVLRQTTMGKIVNPPLEGATKTEPFGLG